jgi:phage-related minor tail protein
LGGIFKFKVSLVYRVSSRTARATQRNPVSKQNKTKQNKIKQNKKTKKNQTKKGTSGSTIYVNKFDSDNTHLNKNNIENSHECHGVLEIRELGTKRK